ncbi:MAG: FtsX-like permease family protein [Pararhodobacter sp.]|nr:FtsX-like permease family protein [Pararhodobacter sp.]
MAFLAVFALALALGAGRLADRWSDALAQSATLRLSAPAGEMATQTSAVLQILRETPGVASVRVIDADEQRALLAPWFGPEMPVERLALPRLIEIIEAGEGFDPVGLRMRLAAEAPGAVLDDHSRWRRPMVAAADRLRMLALVAVALIAGAMAAMVALAASFSLAANAQVIAVLRLVGARDAFIARAFTRRFALRALVGAGVGTALGLGALALFPAAGEGVLAGLGPRGADWLWPLTIPPFAALVAWAATRAAAFRVLRRQG